jgi:hypothetical protein
MNRRVTKENCHASLVKTYYKKLPESKKNVRICSLFKQNYLKLLNKYCSWLRHYAASREVSDLILGEVTGFFD